jgi:hypothetical protein
VRGLTPNLIGRWFDPSRAHRPCPGLQARYHYEVQSAGGDEGGQAKGHLRGKQAKLSRGQEAHLVSCTRTGAYRTVEGTELFGVASPSTFHRAIGGEQDRARADDPAAGPAVAVRRSACGTSLLNNVIHLDRDLG